MVPWLRGSDFTLTPDVGKMLGSKADRQERILEMPLVQIRWFY